MATPRNNEQTRKEHGLPNMLLSTTYALNKSNSKWAAVGLELIGSELVPTVKFSCSSSHSRTINFNENNWRLFKEAFNEITEFLQEAYKPPDSTDTPPVHLSGYDVKFTTAYSKRSITIEETVAENTAVEDDDDDDGEPAAKKKKYAPLLTCFHKVTFEGLTAVRPCIDARLARLAKHAVKLILIRDCIIEYLHEVVRTAGVSAAKSSFLKNYPAFLQYYNLYSNVIHIHVNEKLEEMSEPAMEIALLEIVAFCLPNIYNELHDVYTLK